MCGIAGIVDSRGRFSRSQLLALEPVLKHRGPDCFAVAQEGPLSLLHWRLAIRDLSPAGDQPMVSFDGRFVLCYNGEIYNHEELRSEINASWSASGQNSAASRKWRGHSDTEVIVEGVAIWGRAFIARLNGIFALAIYDRQERLLLLARDRLGVKPLYTWSNGGVFQFASEAKFFFATDLFHAEVSAEGLGQFMTYGHSTGRARLLKGVQQLAPGHLLQIAMPAPASPPTAAEASRYCPPPEWRLRERTFDAAAKELRHLIERVVETQMVSDVPLGVFLSGGVDSSILTAVAARILGSSATNAFTLGYEGFGAEFNELAEARAVAKHLGVHHVCFEAKPDQLIRRLEEVVWHYDEPFADGAALNVFVLSELIRSHVTVALAGEGADELFGGYRRYQTEAWLRQLGPAAGLLAGFAACLSSLGPRLPRRLKILCRSTSARSAAARYSAYFESGIDLGELVQPEWQCPVDPRATLKELYPDRLPLPPIAAMCLADQQFWLVDTYLEKSDKGSMAHSLEVRVPFLDNRVLEFANSLPDQARVHRGHRKRLLKAAFSDLLPDWVFTRFKRGFSIPTAAWLRNELRPFFTDMVLSSEARVKAYLQQPCIERLFRNHCAGEDNSTVLWQTLVFELWLRQVASGFRRPREHAS